MVTIYTFMQARSWEKEREEATGRNESFVALVHSRSFRGERETDLFSNQRPLFCARLLSNLERSSIRRSYASALHQTTPQCKQRANTYTSHCESLNLHECTHLSTDACKLNAWCRWSRFQKKLCSVLIDV